MYIFRIYIYLCAYVYIGIYVCIYIYIYIRKCVLVCAFRFFTVINSCICNPYRMCRNLRSGEDEFHPNPWQLCHWTFQEIHGHHGQVFSLRAFTHLIRTLKRTMDFHMNDMFSYVFPPLHRESRVSPNCVF